MTYPHGLQIISGEPICLHTLSCGTGRWTSRLNTMNVCYVPGWRGRHVLFNKNVSRYARSRAVHQAKIPEENTLSFAQGVLKLKYAELNVVNFG